MKRRNFMAGILAAATAPAIVRASSLMILPPQKIIYAGTPYPTEFVREGSVTGRMVSNQPNLQELPQDWSLHPYQKKAIDELRRQYRREIFVSVDYSYIERRVF